MENVNAGNASSTWAPQDEVALEELNDIDLSLVGGGAFPFIQTA